MKKQNNKLLVLYALGLSTLLILRDVAGVSISKYIFVAYILALMTLAAYDTLVYMLCFTLPLVCGLPATYIMLGALILLIIKRGRINLWQIGLLMFVLAAEIIASLWYPKMDLAALANYVSFAGIMFFLIHDNWELDSLQCVKLYLFGVCLVCGVIMVVTLMKAPSDWLTRFARGAFRFGEEHVADMEGVKLILNANSLAYYSVTGIGCGIFAAEQEKGWKRALYIGLTVFSVVVGFLSLSRSWLLVAVICLLLYICSKLHTPKQFLTLTVLLVILFTVGYFYIRQYPELLDGFISRFMEDNTEDGGGRTQLFWAYMNAFFDDIRLVLMGAGVSQYKTQLGVGGSTHNGTQQILVCYGIIGFIVFVIGLVRPIVTAIRDASAKRRFASWLPLIGVVLFVQTIQFLNPTMSMLPYVIGIYALRAGGKSDENISDNRGHGGGQPLGLETR